ncbi:MAG: hypothetical protein F6K18_02795 [Okeania sp. SIO2C2]|uniref:hypothetical protein n=1 Tax=Okeania sp. SIO2C2 TaxID=2607787 RepID=UPI0013B67240|nr:hypothetical protein [Okeania sp. SIO2C2]NEP85833.1 hypothetical protein [Okeania sp. SIO2C2]
MAIFGAGLQERVSSPYPIDQERKNFPALLKHVYGINFNSLGVRSQSSGVRKEERIRNPE